MCRASPAVAVCVERYFGFAEAGCRQMQSWTTCSIWIVCLDIWYTSAVKHSQHLHPEGTYEELTKSFAWPATSKPRNLAKKVGKKHCFRRFVVRDCRMYFDFAGWRPYRFFLFTVRWSAVHDLSVPGDPVNVTSDCGCASLPSWLCGLERLCQRCFFSRDSCWERSRRWGQLCVGLMKFFSAFT